MFKRHVTWVGVVAVLLLLAGCTITVSNQGRLLVYIDYIPAAVHQVKYDAHSKAGLGHYRSGSRTVNSDSLALEFDPVAAGRWTVQVTGVDRSGAVVFEKEEAVFVSAGELKVVFIDAGGKRPPRR